MPYKSILNFWQCVDCVLGAVSVYKQWKSSWTTRWSVASTSGMEHFTFDHCSFENTNYLMHSTQCSSTKQRRGEGSDVSLEAGRLMLGWTASQCRREYCWKATGLYGSVCPLCGQDLERRSRSGPCQGRTHLQLCPVLLLPQRAPGRTELLSASITWQAGPAEVDPEQESLLAC
eukprot:scaffold108463_cov35-Prasinocladus_malaysianus.AAC.2